MVHSVSRGGGIAAALAAIGLASTLAACASSNSASPAAASDAGSSSARSAPMIPGPSPTTPAASPTASQPVNPGGRMSPAPIASPVQQLTEPPAKSKYVPIEQASQSSDGQTLYLEIEARGGACGQYVVVVQQSATQVAVGIAQLPVRTGVMCPMFIGPRTFTAKLDNPVGTRTVVDLANGARLGG